MHGRGPKAGAPASDAAGTPQTARPCRVVPRGKSRIGPTRLKSAPIQRKSAPTRPKSGRLGPYRPVSAETAESGRNSKKKKKKKCRSDRLTWCRDFFIKNVWCRLSFGKGKPWGNKKKKRRWSWYYDETVTCWHWSGRWMERIKNK